MLLPRMGSGVVSTSLALPRHGSWASSAAGTAAPETALGLGPDQAAGQEQAAAQRRSVCIAAAAALNLPADALLAAAAQGQGGGVCLPVAGLPLLSGSSLQAVVSSYRPLAGCDAVAEWFDHTPGLTCIPSALAGALVRLWCQALPAGSVYSSLGPVCRGLLARHPTTTALLAACFLQAPGDAAAPEAAPAHVLVLEEGFGTSTLLARLASAEHAPLGWPCACGVARDVAAALTCLDAPSRFCRSWSEPPAAPASTPGAAPRTWGAERAPPPTTPLAAAPDVLGTDAASTGAAAPARHASKAVRFLPVLRAADVWLEAADAAGPSGAANGEGRARPAAKVSLVHQLVTQLLRGDAFSKAATPGAAEPAPAVLRLATEGAPALGALLLQLLTERASPAEAVRIAREGWAALTKVRVVYASACACTGCNDSPIFCSGVAPRSPANARPLTTPKNRSAAPQRVTPCGRLPARTWGPGLAGRSAAPGRATGEPRPRPRGRWVLKRGGLGAVDRL